jgi:hypothetical protein
MFDWVAVLDITGDLVAIAGALWAVYEKLIKRRKEPGAEKPPAFSIRVENEKQTFVHLTIHEGTTMEFIEEFTRIVSALRASETGQSAEAMIEFYERSEYYRVSRVRRDDQPPGRHE